MTLPAHHRDPRDQPRPHLPRGDRSGRLARVPRSAAAAASTEQLMLGDAIGHLRQIEHLMAAGRLIVHLHRSPATAQGVGEVTMHLVDIRFGDERTFMAGMAILGTLAAVRARLLRPIGLLPRRVRGGRLGGGARALAALGQLLAKFLVLGTHLLDELSERIHHVPQRLDSLVRFGEGSGGAGAIGRGHRSTRRGGGGGGSASAHDRAFVPPTPVATP